MLDGADLARDPDLVAQHPIERFFVLTEGVLEALQLALDPLLQATLLVEVRRHQLA
jgi:hypothetical protein